MAKKRTGVKAKSNSIQVWFYHGGKRVFETLPWSPTETALDRAARLRKKVVDDIALGVFSFAEYFPDSPRAEAEILAAKAKAEALAKSAAPTFFEVAAKYLDLVDGEQCRIDYRNALNRTWAPLFDTPVDAVKYADILECAKRLDGKSGKYYNNEKVSLNGVLELAKDLDYITENPAAKLKNKDKSKAPPDPFSIEEAESIIAHFYKRYGEVYGAYVEIGFFTGLRSPSELIGLRWENIDLRSGYLRIKERTVRGKHLPGTKTGVMRDVELFDRVVAAFRRLRKFSDGFVFICPDTSEEFKTGKALVTKWNTTLASLGIRHRRMYNMRHTCATYLLESGVHPGVAAEQLGHSLQMFYTIYAKWLSSDKKKSELAKANQPVVSSVAKTPKRPKLV